MRIVRLSIVLVSITNATVFAEQRTDFVAATQQRFNDALTLCVDESAKELVLLFAQKDIAIDVVLEQLTTLNADLHGACKNSNDPVINDFLSSIDLSALTLLCTDKRILADEVARSTNVQQAAECLQTIMVKVIPMIQSLAEGAEKIPLTSEWLAKQSNAVKKVALGGTVLVGGIYGLLYVACNQAGYCNVYLPDLTPLLFLLPKIVPAF